MEISVLVQQSASVNSITQTKAGLTVSLRSAHDEAKTNKALVCVLAKHFKVPKTAVAIANGTAPTERIVQITKHPA